MKRFLAFLLAVLMLFSLCACNDEDYEEDDEDEEINIEEDDDSKVKIEGVKKNGPATDLIMADLKEALREKNEYAKITDTKTVKSLTEKGSFGITLEVQAKTTYADWKYEIDMDYTKYDQGWVVDEVKWLEEGYELARFPDEETMIAYATEYLPKHERVLEYPSSYEYLFPMENAIVEYKFCSDIDKEALYFTWEAPQEGSFALMTCPWTSYWEYDANVDNWVVMSDKDGDNIYLDSLVNDRIYKPVENLDFNGFWGDEVVNMTIENYTPEQFDITIKWKEYEYVNAQSKRIEKTATGHFTRVYEKQIGLEHNQEDESVWVFVDEDNDYYEINNYIVIRYFRDHAYIYYYIDGKSNNIDVFVGKKLPTLS